MSIKCPQKQMQRHSDNLGEQLSGPGAIDQAALERLAINDR